MRETEGARTGRKEAEKLEDWGKLERRDKDAFARWRKKTGGGKNIEIAESGGEKKVEEIGDDRGRGGCKRK